MPAPTNTITSNDVPVGRIIDFVSRFDKGIRLLESMFPNIRMIEHKPGEQLYSHTASVTLNTNAVGEGEIIPYNAVTFTDTPVGTVVLDKQAISPTLESVLKSGEASIQRADDDMIFKMQNNIVNKFITFIQTGTLTSDFITTTFQAAIAEAIGQVQNKWEELNLGYESICGWCNTLDLYRFLGQSSITTQREFGLTYIKDYMGFDKLFYSQRIPSGKVYATPSENIIMDYVNLGNPDLKKLGFKFTMTGERGLIGITTNPVPIRQSTELIAVSGVGLRAEYLNGIAKIEISDGNTSDDSNTEGTDDSDTEGTGV